jgi:hypothetical protein
MTGTAAAGGCVASAAVQGLTDRRDLVATLHRGAGKRVTIISAAADSRKTSLLHAWPGLPAHAPSAGDLLAPATGTGGATVMTQPADAQQSLLRTVERGVPAR